MGDNVPPLAQPSTASTLRLRSHPCYVQYLSLWLCTEVQATARAVVGVFEVPEDAHLADLNNAPARKPQHTTTRITALTPAGLEAHAHKLK